MSSLVAIGFLSKESEPQYVPLKNYDVHIEVLPDVIHRLPRLFMGHGIDASIIVKKEWQELNFDDEILTRAMELLPPSYIRFGGTLSDHTIFVEKKPDNFRSVFGHLSAVYVAFQNRPLIICDEGWYYNEDCGTNLHRTSEIFRWNHKRQFWRYMVRPDDLLLTTSAVTMTGRNYSIEYGGKAIQKTSLQTNSKFMEKTSTNCSTSSRRLGQGSCSA